MRWGTYREKLRHAQLTAIREAVDRELKLDPMSKVSGFSQDGAARIYDAFVEATEKFNDEVLVDLTPGELTIMKERINEVHDSSKSKTIHPLG